MSKLKTLWLVLAAAALALFPGCFDSHTSTEIPNELTGVLLTTAGGPAADAKVILYPVGYIPGDSASGRVPKFATVTDSLGRYTVSKIAAGDYNILGSKDGLVSFSDSVSLSAGTAALPTDTLDVPGSLSGRVQLQPQDDPRSATVQVLGTEMYVNVDSSGAFILPKLAEGTYRLRVVTTAALYTPLFAEATAFSGRADTLPEPLIPFYSGTPVVTGLRAVPDSNGTLTLTWDKPDYNKVQGYLVFRDTVGTLVPSQTQIARVTGTRYVDTIYNRNPKPGQYPYLDPDSHAFEYRVKILDKSGLPGPSFGFLEVLAPSPSNFSKSGRWHQALANAPFPKRSDYSVVAFKDSLWVFGHDTSGGFLWNSPDGLNWAKVADGLPFQGRSLHPLVHDGRLWVFVVREHIVGTDAGGVENLLWSSESGRNWTPSAGLAPFVPREGAAFLEFNGKMWLVSGEMWYKGGDIPAVLSSSDGLTWTAAVTDPVYAHSSKGAVAFKGNIWSLKNPVSQNHEDSSLARSADGKTWTTVATTPRFTLPTGASLVAHTDTLYLIGGAFPDSFGTLIRTGDQVMRSADGVDWKYQDAHAPFGTRAWMGFQNESPAQGAASFKGRLWLVGGGGTLFEPTNDVWYME